MEVVWVRECAVRLVCTRWHIMWVHRDIVLRHSGVQVLVQGLKLSAKED